MEKLALIPEKKIPISVRLPLKLLNRLVKSANTARRTLTAEIVYRLERKK